MTDEPRRDAATEGPNGAGADDGEGLWQSEAPALDERTEGLLDRARKMGEEGDYEGMAEHLRGALADDEGNPWILCWLGVAERTLGMEGVAYERFRQALAADPRDPLLLAIAGTGLADFDDPEAESALRTASILGPEEPGTRWRYGAWLTREGFVDEGIEELVAAARLDAEDPVIAYELGVGYALKGRIDAAIDTFGRAVERAPDDAWVRGMLGIALIEADRADEAAVELDLAAAHAPDDAVLQILVALSRAANGDVDAGWEFVERARFHAEGPDALLVDEAEERLEEGEEAARDFLRTTLAPSALRERLAVRP